MEKQSVIKSHLPYFLKQGVIKKLGTPVWTELITFPVNEIFYDIELLIEYIKKNGEQIRIRKDFLDLYDSSHPFLEFLTNKLYDSFDVSFGHIFPNKLVNPSDLFGWGKKEEKDFNRMKAAWLLWRFWEVSDDVFNERMAFAEKSNNPFLIKIYQEATRERLYKKHGINPDSRLLEAL